MTGNQISKAMFKLLVHKRDLKSGFVFGNRLFSSHLSIIKNISDTAFSLTWLEDSPLFMLTEEILFNSMNSHSLLPIDV